MLAPPWLTACPDWEDRILAGRTLVPDLPLFEDEADRGLRIFNRLRIPDVIGKPRMGDSGTEWLAPIVRAIFGSFNAGTNERMIREFFLLVPKKNSKSSGAAAIMVSVLLVNERPEAEALLIAPTKQIADIAYKQAWGIIQADPTLTKLFYGQSHYRKITYRNTGATMMIKAADTDAITGSKAAFTLIDETHVFASKPRASDVFLELRGALAARPDGFLMQVTTQSKAPPAGVFKAELEVARNVRDGKVRLPILPVLYELPVVMTAKDGWKDRRLWPLVNPNMGRSVSESYLADELLKAEQSGPEAMALLASQHFNVQVGLSLRADRWPGADPWPSRAIKLTLAELISRCDVAVVGIDGGGLDDLLGLAVLGRERGTGTWLLWCYAWAHESVLVRRQSEASKLRDFEAAGELSVVPLMEQARAELADMVDQVNQADILARVGLDPAGVALIVAELAKRDITQERGYVQGVPQGYRLTGTTKVAESHLSDGKFLHADQALMNWCVGNAKVEVRGNAVYVTKEASGTGKIDPVMAMFNAVALLSLDPEPIRANSAYNDPDHDLLVI